jgi:hypothetical protein
MSCQVGHYAHRTPTHSLKRSYSASSLLACIAIILLIYLQPMLRACRPECLVSAVTILDAFQAQACQSLLMLLNNSSQIDSNVNAAGTASSEARTAFPRTPFSSYLRQLLQCLFNGRIFSKSARQGHSPTLAKQLM